ncbi:MAG: leukotoxin LktA family filamentous adhesin, partial [Desulfomonilia bacterium]
MKRKHSQWSFFRRFHRRSNTARKVTAVLTIFSFFFSNFVFATQIVTDGRTDTQVSPSAGNVTNVTTGTIRGINAFNSFSQFNVYSGDIVNLHVPGTALNLVNLVHSEATTINGLLNSIQNGQIGGNIFFLNPHGFMVGQQGVINVGSLTAITPTVSFMEEFFDSPGNPSPASVDMMFTGAVPIRENGLISIQGTVNAINDINLLGGSVDVAGTGLLTTGAYFDWHSIDFSDVVNTGEIEDGAVFSIENGDIYIRAREIKLEAGSKLLANVEDGSIHQAGDITLEAVDIEETPLIRLGGNESKTAKITIDGATISGGNIDIRASAGDSNPEDGEPTIQDNWTFGELETLLDDNISLLAAVMIKRAEAVVKINEDPANETIISASGNVNISALSSADGTVKAISGGIDPLTNNPVTNIFSVGYSKAEATAKVEVGTGVVIDAAGDVSLQSDASATASATARTSQNLGVGASNRNNIAVSLAIAKSDTTSHATVAEGSSVTAGGTIAVHARGQSTNVASAETGTYDDGLAGVAVGLGFSDADILARVGGTLMSQGVLPAFSPVSAVTDGAFDLGVDHGLITGQQVRYDNGGGAGIGGLEHRSSRVR